MIRKYKESNFKDVEIIYNCSKKDEFIGEDFDVVVVPLSEDVQMLDLFKKSKIYVYDSGEVFGFVGVKENYISWLFVHPDYRGKNIGKKLVLYALSILKGEVTLHVARSNVIAIDLYKSVGFSIAKEFTGDYQGKPIEVCKMIAIVNSSSGY